MQTLGLPSTKEDSVCNLVEQVVSIEMVKKVVFAHCYIELVHGR